MKQSTIKNLLKLNNDLYESEAFSWSKTRTDLWEKPVKDITDNILPNSSILDLGCGNARLYQLLAKKKIKYLGIDPSKNMIKLNKFKYPEAQFKTGDGLKLNFKNQFDYIFSIAVLHHIPGDDFQKIFLSNCLNALKNNGTLALTVWNRHRSKYQKYFNLLKPYSDMLKNDLIVPWKNTTYKRYIHAFTSQELKVLSQKVGFNNIKCYYIDKYDKSDIKNGLNILLTAQK